MNQFKQQSSVLLEMILIDILYLIIGETVILIFITNKEFCAIGFFIGVIISIFNTILMKLTINKLLHRLGKTAIIWPILAYSIRMIIMATIFVGMYIYGIGDILAGLIGMFALKVSAYLQPLSHKVLKKF